MKKSAKTFVGFGFGPIQGGLFLCEAQACGNFRRLVVSEIDDSLVRAVRDNRGRCRVNIARTDGIERREVAGVELYNPRDGADRREIVAAMAESDEMATALPSVSFYDAGAEASVVGLLAEGLAHRPIARPTVLYAAENHNRAAEILTEKLSARVGESPSGFQALNTVIGKMSGVITDAAVIRRLGLATITPDIPRAILVEEFSRILISRVAMAGFRRGITVFQEKDDLLPFEEAKLYGHNAIHALVAYLADLRGCTTIAEAGRDERIMAVARKAFVEESGAAMIHRNAKTGDELFTPAGWRAYAEDLLERMVCPYLNDFVSRVGRDHARKLAYGDRLFGTMRLAMDAGVEPAGLALGAAGAVLSMIKRRNELSPGSFPPALPQGPEGLSAETLRSILTGIWGTSADSRAAELIALTWAAVQKLREGRW